MDLIDQLEAFIEDNGFKQYEVAEMIDCSRATFNRWLKRKHAPTKAWQKILERFLHDNLKKKR